MHMGVENCQNKRGRHVMRNVVGKAYESHCGGVIAVKNHHQSVFESLITEETCWQKAYKQLLFRVLGSPGPAGALGPDKASRVWANASGSAGLSWAVWPPSRDLRPVCDAHDPGVGRDGPFLGLFDFYYRLARDSGWRFLSQYSLSSTTAIILA